MLEKNSRGSNVIHHSGAATTGRHLLHTPATLQSMIAKYPMLSFHSWLHLGSLLRSQQSNPAQHEKQTVCDYSTVASCASAFQCLVIVLLGKIAF